MHRFLLAVTFALICASARAAAHDPAASIPWFQGTVEQAFAEARKQNRPVFLFWSAVWCPYCQDLKASVFPRPDFLAKLSFFVPVNLDGDAPGAQKIADEFHVSGYPTVLVLKPDRRELARISGGMDLNRYAEVLDGVLGDVKPVNEMLSSLEHGKAMLSAGDCRRLAYNAWSLDPTNTSGPAELKHMSAALARAAERCPADSKVERARLTILATAAATDSEEDALASGKPASSRTAALVASVSALLADVPLSTSVADSFQELSDNFFLAVKRSGPTASAQLLERWLTVMNAFASDARYSEGQQLAAVASELTASKALDPNGAIPAALAANARSHLQTTLSHKQDSYTRAAVINAAIDILDSLDDNARAYSLLEAELKTANTPYYYMPHLAALDEKLGNKSSAISWLKRAYEESRGPATRFRYGSSYVTGLIRMRPTDTTTIRDATLRVLGELDADSLHNGTTARLQRLEKALRKWNANTEHEDVITAARARMNEICSKVPATDTATSTCRTFLPRNGAPTP
jgi:thiol-disulfide isomerase/thioredoxin